MSNINDLIKELCPNGVKYLLLDDIAKLSSGEFVRKDKQVTNGYPVYNGGASNTGYYDEYNTDENKIIISARGAAGFVNIIREKFWAGNSCHIIDVQNDEVDWQFVYYVLKNKQDSIIGERAEGTIPSVSQKQLKKIAIPIPPLAVQKEIVKILDKFSELEARKKQYEFWSGKIFESNMNEKTKHITDIALVKARVGWQRLTTAEYLNAGNYYLITGTDFDSDGRINFDSCVYVTKDRYSMDENIQVHKSDILITKDGTLGKVAFLSEEPEKLATLNSGVFRIKITDENVLPRYIYHYFNSKIFKDFVESVKTGSTISHLTQEKLVKLDIPIPNIEKQSKIITILDKFDCLTRSMAIGLPSEIELRRKQYEYYRNKLLSFEELRDNE